MLSVCIPIYNFDVTALVHELHRQLIEAAINFEIVLMDDASNASFQNINSDLQQLQHCSYILLSPNVGRAAIRNKLATAAQYENLLFMDCDAKAPIDFIRKYLAAITEKTEVIVGGRSYNNAPPKDPNQRLRWLFGTHREVFMASDRNTNPYRSFLTCNFLVKKKMLHQIPFDERLTAYGHEDTLFGYQLSQLGVHVAHIDNPLEHIQLESADEFLAKTRKGIANLKYIHHHIEPSLAFAKQVKLLNSYQKLKHWKLAGIFSWGFSLFEKRIERYLLSESPGLFWFDVYKLGVICAQKE